MIVVVGNGVLHYLTRTERGLDIGFSSCTAPTSYSCPSISGAFQGLQGFWKCQKWSGNLEVIWNWSIVQREGSIEVKYEARSLEAQGFSGSPEQRGCGRVKMGSSSQ